MFYLTAIVVIFIIFYISNKLSIVNTNFLCSSVLDYKNYKNYKNSCKLNCELNTSYVFPTFINDTCYKKKLYIIRNRKYFSLFTLNISHFSYESKYLYSTVVIVFFYILCHRKIIILMSNIWHYYPTILLMILLSIFLL